MTDHLAKAHEALESALLLVNAGHDAGAANRAYYAIFHAARAVVARHADIKLSDIKTHQGLRRMFELYVVKSGLIDREIASHFNDVELTRLVADYGDETLSRAEVEASIRDARAFVNACENLLRGEIS